MKQILGCNFQTSNDMARADLGCRPLLLMIIKRYISYKKSLANKTDAYAMIPLFMNPKVQNYQIFIISAMILT